MLTQSGALIAAAAVSPYLRLTQFFSDVEPVSKKGKLANSLVSFSHLLSISPTDIGKSFRDRGVPREFRHTIDNSWFSGVPKKSC